MARPPFIRLRELLEAVASGCRPRIVDARGSDGAQQARIPGAVPVPARDLHPVTGGVRRLATAEDLSARLAERGIGREAVVVYGGNGGADAAHLWWTLHYLGHEHAYLLDGGIEAWIGAGHPVEDGPVADTAPSRQPLPRGTLPDRVIDLEELRARLGDARLAILDARAPQEYGATADEGAHIPGARSFPWTDALGNGTELRERSELRSQLADLLMADEVVTYCQSGVRAAHACALLRWLGHPRPRLYMGSWAEWGRQLDVPDDST